MWRAGLGLKYQRSADLKLVPAVCDVVERNEHTFQSFRLHSRSGELEIPVLGQRCLEASGLPGRVENCGESFGAASMRTLLLPELPLAHPLVDELLVDGEKDPRIAASSELTEHPTVDAPLGFGHEVKQVMGRKSS